MIWQEISIAVPHEYVEPVSYLFGRYGRVLSMESAGPNRIVLRTYLPATSHQRRARIEVGIKLISLLEPLGDLTVTEVPEEDWQNSWKSHFNLLKIGLRVVIKPSWIDYQGQPGEVIIEIDPGMAFGTGYHPTTYTCLQALEQWVKTGDSVLDLGTGSGILSIAALGLGATKVVALDIDPQAVRAARRNFRRTGTTQQVTLAQGNLPQGPVGPGQFDLIVANISARAVCERAPFICPTLAPSGILIASGFTKGQETQVITTLNELGYCMIQEWDREDWVTLGFRKDLG